MGCFAARCFKLIIDEISCEFCVRKSLQAGSVFKLGLQINFFAVFADFS